MHRKQTSRSYIYLMYTYTQNMSKLLFYRFMYKLFHLKYSFECSQLLSVFSLYHPAYYPLLMCPSIFILNIYLHTCITEKWKQKCQHAILFTTNNLHHF